MSEVPLLSPPPFPAVAARAACGGVGFRIEEPLKTPPGLGWRKHSRLCGERRRPFTAAARATYQQREFFIDNLLVRIHFIIVMIRWTGLPTDDVPPPSPPSPRAPPAGV